MEIDMNENSWATPCPKYDCRKTACKCGLEYVNIPASLGDDSEGSNVAPKNGAYCNALVFYEANGHVYIYTKEGIPTLIDVDASDISTLEQEVRKAQKDVHELREDIDDFIYGFDTVAQMKAATNLSNGDRVRTLGYYAKGDHGGALYKVTNTQPSGHYETLSGLLYAELILEDKTLKPEQFGAYGDGTHDDTTNLQSSIDYSIANNLALELNGNYLVSPTLRNDNTYVCLTYEKRGTGQQFVGTEIRFNRGAKIRTSYNDGECTLLRVESRNARITNGIFEGVQGKTNLLEFSRIDKSDTNYNGYNLDNLVDNCVFRYGKNAMSMEGAAYYNKFTNDRIYNCNIGILLQMTYLEKQGLEQTASVNRNDFVDVNMNLITDWGIKIEYGDTNKFVNVDLEGCANGIYIDDPKLHSSDFPIAPLYNTATNKFVNIMMESITTTTWYNRAIGTSIINTSSSWDNKANFVIHPQDFLGGYDDTTSIEKVNGIIKSKDAVVYTNQKQWSYLIPADAGVRGLYDIKIQSGSVVNKNRQTFQFDGTKNTNITTLTYDSSKPIVKSLGGIVFMAGCLFIVPTSTSTTIKLYFPENLPWMKGVANMYQNVTYGQPGFIVPYYKGGTLSECCCTIREEYIELAPINGGSWSDSWNVFKLNLSWFSADANV